VQRYRNRLSGPLLDRIDIQVEVPRIQYKELSEPSDGDSSTVIRERVNSIRAVQRQRLQPYHLHCNAQMESRHLRKFCKVGPECEKLLEMVTDRLGFSARTYTRILKVARTIADLAGSKEIQQAHLAEAIQYRSLDRQPI
jgi:magnesium chelatase family protein